MITRSKDPREGTNKNYEFGRRLTEVIDKRDMKYYHVAMECELGKASLCHYMYGNRMPRLDIFMKIARTMNFTDEEITYILGAFTEEWLEEHFFK